MQNLQSGKHVELVVMDFSKTFKFNNLFQPQPTPTQAGLLWHYRESQCLGQELHRRPTASHHCRWMSIELHSCQIRHATRFCCWPCIVPSVHQITCPNRHWDRLHLQTVRWWHHLLTPYLHRRGSGHTPELPWQALLCWRTDGTWAFILKSTKFSAWRDPRKSLQLQDSQSFLQLSAIGRKHDPHLRIIGGHCETLEGHAIHMLQNKG